MVVTISKAPIPVGINSDYLSDKLLIKEYGTSAGLSARAGGGAFSSAIRVWWAGYEARMKADIKSSQSEVKKHQNR